MRLLPSGPRAVLAEVDDTATVLALVRRLDADPLPGLVDVVAAERTVLLVLDGDLDAVDLDGLLVEEGEGAPAARTTEPVVIDVTYDGADLDEVAERVRLSVEAVVAAHTGAVHDVAFFGFAPGFAYLTGAPDVLHLPRRDTPRTHVPAGSVAVAAGYSAVYPTGSPGGWHLLGRTDAVMWDLDRPSPALLAPGDRVRFRAR